MGYMTVLLILTLLQSVSILSNFGHPLFIVASQYLLYVFLWFETIIK